MLANDRANLPLPTAPRTLAAAVTLIATATMTPSGARAQMTEIAPIAEEPGAPAATPAPGSGPAADARPPAPTSAAPAPPASQGGPVILEEFEVDERNVVLSAARTRTSIQEAPGIITVITAEEIAERGHRTVSEALQMVPGWEGHRLDSNGWFDEAVVRGQPRTLLILVNGVNVTEPLRNGLSLDRRIPVEAIKRIEVTSGPGGVLWGSNALMGIVNVILKDAADLDGLQVIAGGGHGASARAAAQGAVAYGDRFFDGDVELFTSVSYYSDAGDELTVDSRKIVGALPAPEPDSTSAFVRERDTTDWNSRDWWLTSTGNVKLFQELTLDWLVEFEQDHRQLATGGAILRGEKPQPDGSTKTVTEETIGNDALQTVGLSWRRRFLDDRLGLSTKAYGVRFTLDEDPFWAFPPSALPTLDEGIVIALNAGRIYRFGLNVDADLELPFDNHLLFGAEGFRESFADATRRDRLRNPRVFPDLAVAGDPDPNVAAGVFPRSVDGGTQCPPPGSHRVLVRDGETTADFDAGCVFTDTLLIDAARTVGAIYISDEWKAASTLALQPGFRMQFSDSYDPVGLFSGALVWNVFAKLFVKLNYAEGFRPPELQATRVNNRAVSNVGYQSNPDLEVERSRSTEAEVNAVVAEGYGVLERVYLRGDYAYTVLSDLVRNVSGQFANSGQRGIHAVEALARVDFVGGHELWFGGAFNRAEDSVLGPIRNFPNVTFTGGGKVQILPKYLEAMTGFTWIGPQEDLNRDPDAGYAVFGGQYTGVDAAEVVVDEIGPTLLLRAGIRATHLWDDRLTLSVFGYNLLDDRTGDPDFYFEDRVQSRPQPKGGFSVFGQGMVTF
jgi:outer membrane receptor protein involved in Fe transport